MQLIDADKAQPGMTIVAYEQTRGKGQRGKHWAAAPGESLLMSVICTPGCSLERQFVFSANLVTSIADVLKEMDHHIDLRIKWPNDIIVNDKKAGGILIENVLRGSNWNYSVIGIGINVLQTSFPTDLPFAMSLKIATGKNFSINELVEKIRSGILLNNFSCSDHNMIMEKYNYYLFRKDTIQKFSDSMGEFSAIIQRVEQNGKLVLEREDGSIHFYNHGDVQWVWE